MTDGERRRFDALVARVIDALPEPAARVLDECPVIVEDAPSRSLLLELAMDPDAPEDLCGLHTGVANTERSIDAHPTLPTQIHLFRLGILSAVGGWRAGDHRVLEEIRVTLLHEIGHQMGLDEDDLEDLGYA